MARILVVDDDEHMCRLVKRMLETGGHEATSASGGDMAMELIEAVPPDLVVTDLMMACGRGMDVITHCKKMHPNLPVIAVSARPQYLETARTLGAAATLSKPFNKGDLLAVVYQLLER